MKTIEERLAEIEKKLGIEQEQEQEQEQEWVWVANLNSMILGSRSGIYKVPLSAISEDVDETGDHCIDWGGYPRTWVNQRFVNKDLGELKAELKKFFSEIEVIKND